MAISHNHSTSDNGKASKTYNCWRAMKQRCSHPSQRCYPDYGGRGIKFCARWDKFENFLADMGPKPEGMTLERIEVNGNYEPGNCCWLSAELQNSNKRNTKNLKFRNRIQTRAEWSRELGIARSTIDRRLDHMRWTTEQALTTPIAKGGRNVHSGKKRKSPTKKVVA